MVAVPKFEAYALSRPEGWPAGIYQGTFEEDGLRLFREGKELLYLPVGTPTVKVNGRGLIIPVSSGELEVELRPPAPADPAATALAFSLYLAGSRQAQRKSLDRSKGVPGWLGLMFFLPIVACVGGALVGIFWITGVGSLVLVTMATLVNCRMEVEKRVRAVVTVSVLGTTLMFVGTVIGMMIRGVKTPGPVPEPMRRY